MLIDTHAHLYWDSYQQDLDQVVQRALESDVKTIINVGVDLETSKTAVEQITTLSPLSVYASIGIHPHEADKYASAESIHNVISELEELYREHSEKVVAIGECGLDHFFKPALDGNPPAFSEKELKQLQKNIYTAQVHLARRLDLPLIIHCRDAWDEIFVDELQGAKGVFHSFTGTQEDVLRVVDLGFYLSFNGMITYPKNDALREIVKLTPLDKILTETDCPFLPPQRVRGQRNEPAYVLEVVKAISEVRNISFEETSANIYQNAQKLFHRL